MRCSLQGRVPSVWVQVGTHNLAGITCRLFLSYCLQVVTDEDHRSAFLAVGVFCPGPLRCSHLDDYICDFRPVSDPDFSHSVLVCDTEHIYFHVGLCGSKFVLSFIGVLFGIENCRNTSQTTSKWYQKNSLEIYISWQMICRYIGAYWIPAVYVHWLKDDYIIIIIYRLHRKSHNKCSK